MYTGFNTEEDLGTLDDDNTPTMIDIVLCLEPQKKGKISFV